jgi:hypothetical protein
MLSFLSAKRFCRKHVMKYIWILGLLILLTSCDSDNLLPRQSELQGKIPHRKLTSLSELVKAPDDALVCALGPYEWEVPAHTVEGTSINDTLKKLPRFPFPGHLPEENEWLLVIAIRDEVHVMKYEFTDSIRPLMTYDFPRMSEKGWSVRLPDGFTPTQCSQLKTASFYKTGFDRSYLIFGTSEAPKP